MLYCHPGSRSLRSTLSCGSSLRGAFQRDAIQSSQVFVYIRNGSSASGLLRFICKYTQTPAKTGLRHAEKRLAMTSRSLKYFAMTDFQDDSTA